MKSLLVTIVVLAAGLASGVLWAEDGLFPDVDEQAERGTSLGSAITTFDNILEDAPREELGSLTANETYNEERIATLQAQLAEKTAYLESLPEVVSREFNEMMAQYPDADQAQRNRIADELHGKWKSVETRLQREIGEIREQLARANGRLSETSLRRRMLEINGSLSDSERAFGPQDSSEGEPAGPEISSAYTTLDGLARRRALSKIRTFCVIHVRPLDVHW